MTDKGEYWEKVYATKAETEVSWFQSEAARSLALIRSHAPLLDTPVVDVGGGASRLVDALIAARYNDVTVLDIAEGALARSRLRLGTRAKKVDWIVADITAWRPSRQWGLWHDRAVFHFLTDDADQEAYLRALTAATRPNSVAIISTFALDGPDRCSGLPVQRYSVNTLAARLQSAFVLKEGATEEHRTPSGSNQNFIYAVFVRR